MIINVYSFLLYRASFFQAGAMCSKFTGLTKNKLDSSHLHVPRFNIVFKDFYVYYPSYGFQVYVDDSEFTAAYEGTWSARGQGSGRYLYLLSPRGQGHVPGGVRGWGHI